MPKTNGGSSDPTPSKTELESEHLAGQSRRRRFRRRLLVFALLAIALTAAFLAIDITESMRSLGDWIDDLGWWAGPLFVAVHALAVVVLIPGAVFPLMAGFLFGPLLGATYSAFGKTLGAVTAFSIARYLIGGHRRSVWLADLRGRFPKLALLETSAVEGGWKSLATIRLIPAIPFKLSSYLFGWTQFKMKDFVLGTLLGTIPYSITNAYLGSLAGSVSGLGEAPIPTTATGSVLYALAAMVALAAALVAGAKARRILKAAEVDHSHQRSGRAQA